MPRRDCSRGCEGSCGGAFPHHPACSKSRKPKPCCSTGDSPTAAAKRRSGSGIRWRSSAPDRVDPVARQRESRRSSWRTNGMTERVDCVVIGAGVVGLAVARRLAMAGREVIVLESADMIGTGTSSRNSEVIHAGIYYPTGSFKAKACVAGKHALYDYCAAHGVPHKRIGKIIVASAESEIPKLKALQEIAAANGVPDLEWLDKTAVERLEPAVRAVAGLLSPSTGIIDSHGLMLAYQGDAEAHGAMFAFNSPVIGGIVTGEGVLLRVGGAEPMDL